MQSAFLAGFKILLALLAIYFVTIHLINFLVNSLRNKASGKKPAQEFHLFVFNILHGRKTGGGGTPLYKVYRYVPPQRVWFLSRFGLK